MNTVLTQS